MRLSRTIAVITLILSVLLIIFPLFIMTPCSGALELTNGATVPMKCHWTALATSAVGGISLISSIAVLLGGKAVNFACFLPIFACGAFGLLLPTAIIGTCKSAAMACNAAMKPAVCLISALIAIVSLVGLVARLRENNGLGGAK